MKRLNVFAIGIILASSTLTVMGGSIIAPVLNLMREGLGADPASAGIIITTHGIFIAICSPLVGILIDRVGVKRPFVAGLVLYGLAGGSGLLITSYRAMILSRVFLGMGVAAIFTSVTVMILNLYEGAERNRVMGWRGSGNNLGGIIWPSLGGFLGRFSWHLPFAAYLVGIPIGILAMFALPDVRRKKTVDHRNDNNKTSTAETQKMSVLQIFKHVPILFLIYGLIFFVNILLYVLVVFLPQHLEKIDISNPFHIGMLISIAPLCGGIISLNYGRIRERLSYRMIMVIALGLWTIGFPAISQYADLRVIVMSVALFGIGQGLVMPALMVWVGESVPVSFRGRISSYLGTFGFVGQFCSPLIFGPVALSFGLSYVFLTAGCASALFCLVVLVFVRQ